MSQPRFPTPAKLLEQDPNGQKGERLLDKHPLKQWAGRFAPPGVNYEGKDTLLGPFPSFFYFEEIMEPFFKLGYASVFKSGLSRREVKIGIHAVRSVYNAPFIGVAHHEASKADPINLTEQQLQDMLSGEVPEGFSNDEKAFFELAVKLAKARGPISQQDFEKAERVLRERNWNGEGNRDENGELKDVDLGRKRIAVITHLVAGYCYIALLCNVADAPTGAE